MPEILRFFLIPGHGLGNATPHVFDTGAIYGQFSEYAIVSKLAVDVFNRLYRETEFSVVLTPHCSTACAANHPNSGHRKYTIAYLNDTTAPFDAALFLHMNSAARTASGVEVFYSDQAPPIRKAQAEAISRTISEVLGIPNRGAKPDNKSNRANLDVLDDTEAPSFLIEFGFINNSGDVAVIEKCGSDALVAAMKAVRKVK